MNQHHLLVLVVASITTLLIFSFVEYSNAQSFLVENRALSDYDIFIYVQTILRNSEGQLVTYLGSNEFTFLDIDALNNLLDIEASENDPIITINEKKFQIIKREMVIPYHKENSIASTLLAHNTRGDQVLVARFAHDGYPIIQGDVVTSIWTFIRPVE